ncbi:CBS domain-containing protein [Bacteroidota bacterium]
MKISASLYSSKEKNLEDLVRDLDLHYIDKFHIDCNDDPSVFNDIRRIREISSTPIDLHIISENPEQYFENIQKYQIEYVQVQFENLNHFVEFPRDDNTEFGVAILSDTSADMLEPYRESCSFILLMTTTPGKSGGIFGRENFSKIREVRNTYPGKRICVDGGVNAEVSFILRNMGVDTIVSGSYLVNHDSVGAALLNMRTENIHSHFLVQDFMIGVDDIPVIKYEEATIPKVLQVIDDYNLGFTFYLDKSEKFHGLSSNADVRKGLLKNLDDLGKTSVDQIVNTDPVTIDQDATIEEMLNIIKKQRFLVSFLPVIDKERNLMGAVTFFNLIRGEL